MLLVTVLRWTVERLSQVRANAVIAYPDVDVEARAQLDTAFSLLETEPVSSAPGLAPAGPELTALRHEGTPWTAVADVADELRTIETSITELAWRLLLPDDQIRWRLFHLGVLGVLLQALRESGCTVQSLRPFGGWPSGPAYTITDPNGRFWDLWFEASSIWTYEEAASPYVEATAGLPGAGRALGADLLLICPGEHALAVECKYSANPDVVGRDGYYQAVTYAAEIRSRLAPRVTAVVVGPEGVVTTPSFTKTIAGDVGTVPPTALLTVVPAFLSAAPTAVDQGLPEVYRV